MPRGNLQICKACVSNYQALVNRWKNDPKLKAWWKAQSKEQEKQWYKKELTHGHGQKRKFDEVSFQLVESTVGYSDRRMRQFMIPVRIYIRNRFCEGVGRTQAIQEFCEYVSNNRGRALYENGQWHIPDYGGIEAGEGQRREQGFEVNSRANISSQKQLTDLMNEGQTIAEAAFHSGVQSLTNLTTPVPADMIPISRNPASGYQLPGPGDEAATAIFNEVGVWAQKLNPDPCSNKVQTRNNKVGNQSALQ